MPTDNGYKSVGYKQITTAVGATFVDIVQIYDDTGLQANLAITAEGLLWVMQTGSTAWTSMMAPPRPAAIAGKRMTVGTVGGVSYIYFSNIGCYTYDFATNTLTATPLVPGAAGFTEADVLGVTNNRSYLLAYTKDSVFWSSLLDATDFNPSLTTGAGGGALEGARGIIMTLEAVYGGFIAFTNKNAVSAIASDNTRFPFNFLEIPSAGGLPDASFVSYDSNSSTLYAYTTAGLQQLGLKGSNTIHPEATDFISGNLFESYNESTNTLTRDTAAGAVVKKRIVVVASRYLIISYGIVALTDAIVYDTIYKQWGKLKIDHVDCFEWVRSDTESAKNSIAFCTSTGALYTLDMDIQSSVSNGVMLLGKYQYHRSRLITLEKVEVENVIQDGSQFTLLDLPTIDGKNFAPAIVGYNSAHDGLHRQYLFHNTAVNHTIVLKGNWNASSMIITFHVHGKR
jgi:hypothetical protein